MEQLATAIVGALIAGAAKITTQAVGDVYASSKQLISELVPRFDSETAAPSTKNAAVEDLAQRLKGLTESERAELAKKMGQLAQIAGDQESANLLLDHYAYVVRGNAAGEDATVDLQAEGGHLIEENRAGRTLTIKTGALRE